MAKVLIDTGVFIALFDGDDKFHQQSVEFIKNNRRELVTTLANITESLYLLDHTQTQSKLLQWIDLARITIINFSHQDMRGIADLIEKYANVPMDFADGCLLHIANTQNISHVATIDSDFYIYKIQGKYPFKLVLSE